MVLSAGLGIANFMISYSADTECVKRLGMEAMAGDANTLLFISIFSALFLGTDYSNGTIRNKLVIGHTRGEIYFSNLLTAAAGGLLLLSAAWIPVFAVGLCLDGEMGMPADELALKMLICICAVIASCAVFTVIGMLFSSKSTIVTITLVSTFALTLGAAVMLSLLTEPEYVSVYEFSADGSIVQTEPVPNPMYVGGAKRDIVTALNDVLPSGQIMQLETGSVHNAELLPLYSLGIISVATAAGALVFRRKDLR
ncbi:MAG: ABC transporter permease [Ruminococcus sp.]|nr:ABC transporter permease [Ruminococcus sp.]